MKRLLLDEDPRVRLGAERLVLGLLHGRPAAADADEDGIGRPDPEAVGLRLANLLASAFGKDGPEEADRIWRGLGGSPAPSEETPASAEQSGPPAA